MQCDDSDGLSDAGVHEVIATALHSSGQLDD